MITAISVLIALIFSKYFYLAALTSYYTFYLISKFHVSVQSSQLHLFAFLAAVAAGTLIGGPVGDRVGRKSVIWCSILGVLPFTLVLPYANLFWTGIFSVHRPHPGSAFPAILVYAQDSSRHEQEPSPDSSSDSLSAWAASAPQSWASSPT